ncbi:MAG: YacP-like NYN domain protein [Syntrophus sp. PtaB.Bin138]|jgi:predicted RNA-binding protein with PIN domain|uniref:NYN domain-containing protein n=1 Tax=Syntrophus sp. (in: bacteria) TaxID=48412 RepID=UPI0009C7E57E|nr:MAG: YacP-like NYN domain protein [Syntrophus sp. PtaB.Bin138]
MPTGLRVPDRLNFMEPGVSSRLFSAMHIIIDGYNLIRQSETFRRFEKQSLEAGRQALLQRVSLYRQQKGHRITVVFDGWESGSPFEERDRQGGITIIYSRRGEKADDVIKRMTLHLGEETVVVTSDRDVAGFVLRRGATALSSPEFETAIARAAASEKSPAGADDPPEETEEEKDRKSGGTRKKGPAHRLSRREKAARSRLKKL